MSLTLTTVVARLTPLRAATVRAFSAVAEATEVPSSNSSAAEAPQHVKMKNSFKRCVP